MRFLLLSLALLLSACGQHKAEPQAHPALWRATNGTATVWLLGTIHILPPGTGWRTPAIEKAINGSSRLMLEIAPSSDPKIAAARFLALGRAKGLPPIAERVPADKRAALDAAIAASGSTEAGLDGMKSWAAAVLLGAGGGRSTGATLGDAPEAVLAGAFTGKRIDALETLDGQFALFDMLPEDAQRVLLVQSLNGVRDYQTLLAAWRTGDVAALERAYKADMAQAPAVEEVLVTERNRAWAERLATSRGTTLVAVGAGHMVGPSALPALLSQHGFRVARIE